MKKLKTTWNHSLETEADRIIQAAANTFNRFYLKYGFLVLPHRIDGNASTVYLPNLNFSSIPGFIKKVSRIEPKKIPLDNDGTHQSIGNKLTEFGWQPEKNKIRSLQKQWQAKAVKFWSFIFQTFPELKKKQITIEIRPTSFGSICSFSLADLSVDSLKIKFYLRVDGSAANIAEAILSSLFARQIEKENHSWEEREGIVDFLIKHTGLQNIFSDYQPTLDSIRKKEKGKLVSESQKYLKRLGVPTGKIFSIKKEKILIDRKMPFRELTKNEKKLLELLVKNKNQLCSFDQIAEVIWQEKADELFSPWAIAKLTQRLRGKLQVNGLSEALIQTQRGKGYVLRD